jgi:hypothetical protein
MRREPASMHASAGDRATGERLMADAFVPVSTRGTAGPTVLGKQGWRERTVGPTAVGPFTVHDPRVDIAGETALVTTGWSQEARRNGADWSIEAQMMDEWVRHDGQWQVVSRYSRVRE